MGVVSRWWQPLAADEAAAFEEERTRHNLERLGWSLALAVLIHLVHVALFSTAPAPGAAPAVVRWRELVALLHQAMLPLAAAGLVLARLSGRRGWTRLGAALPPAFSALYLAFGAASAGVDQLVTSNVTPFLVVSLALAAVFRWRPAHAVGQAALALAVFAAGQLEFQPEAAARLANLVNGLTVTLLSLLAGVSVTAVRQRDFAQRRTIRRQAEEQAAALGHLRDLAERAEAASRAKSAFLAAMSHEIRTPLTGVLGVNEVLAATPLSPEQLALVRTVSQAGQSLLSIVGDVLDFSKIEAGQLSLEVAPFDLKALVETVRQLFAARTAEKRLTLEVRWPEGAPRRYLGDALRVQQVLSNLVGNAVKFTERGGVRIEVAAAPAPAMAADEPARELVTVRVVDTGIGLDPAQQARLFQPYAQADGGTARRFGGTGLGLVICKRLLEAMGGTLGVESAPGRGSTFWLSVALPLDATAPEAERGPGPPGEVFAGRVLVAEDNPVNLLVARQLLAQLGVEVVEARDGRAALALLEGQGADLVLTDLHMPELDGVGLALALRAAGRTVPIIAMSADVQPQDRARCLAAGMDGFLPKPFTRADLAGALARWLGRAAPPGTPSPPAAS